MEKLVNASDGKPIRISTRPSPFAGIEYGSPIPMMDRDPDRAGQTVTVMGYELSYDSYGDRKSVV